MRLRASVIAIIAMILASAGGWAISKSQDDSRAPLAQALEALPADARVAGFTDWARIREALGFDGPVTSAIDRASLVSNAYERDVSARSILEDYAEVMDGRFGWSIADLRWEVYGQASDGAVMVAGMNDGLAANTVTSGLRDMDYEEADGVWSIAADDMPAKLPGLPATFANVTVLDDQGLIVMSDEADYVETVVSVSRGHDPSLAGVTAARETAAPLVGAASALLATGKDACDSTGFADQPTEVVEQARNIVRPLGELATVSYGGRAMFDDAGDQVLRFSMTFDSAAIATRQSRLRAALTTGPFIGRSGQTEDLLTLTSTHTDGPNATMDFGVDTTKGSFMNGRGPVLFAACAPG